MKVGSYYADFGASRSFSRASFRTHYLRPKSHLGYLPGIQNAGQSCQRFFYLAQLHWERGSIDRASIYLGAAAHLVQDLCNPFHTTHKNLREHTDYERKMTGFHRFAVHSEGIYRFRPLAGHYDDRRPFGWVDFNAHRAARRLKLMMGEPSGHAQIKADREILVAAQKSTAGFIALFFQSVDSAALPYSVRSSSRDDLRISENALVAFS